MEHKEKRIQENKGITLIALVVTIGVLIMLTSASINAVLGQNGIIGKAKQAKESYEKSVKKEEESMQELLNEMAQYDAKEESGSKYKFTIKFLSKSDKKPIAFEDSIIYIYNSKNGSENGNDTDLVAKIDENNGKNSDTKKSIYLESGTYWLKVNNVPPGYNNLVDIVEISVGKDNANEFTIYLATGSMLPST